MTQYEKLQNLLNEKQNISGLRGRLRTSVSQLLSDGFTHTGSSGWISVRRGASKEIWTKEISDILTKLNIAHECGNDAPRGGANGEYVKVTSPAFVKVVKKVQAERNARWEAEMKEAAEKAAIAEEQRQARRKHQAWVEEEAAKLNIEDYREDITKIYTEVIGYKLPTDKCQINHLSRKLRGKVAWNLSHMHKGFNIEVLCQALFNYQLVKF